MISHNETTTKKTEVAERRTVYQRPASSKAIDSDPLPSSRKSTNAI